MYSYLCGLITNSSALEHALSSTRLCMRSRFSHVQFFATPWTIARQAPVSMGLSRQEYWSGLPFPPPGDLPDPGIERLSLMILALADGFFTTSTTWEALIKCRGSRKME